MTPRRRQAPGYFDGLYGRPMLRAIASMTAPGGDRDDCWIWLGAFSTAKGAPTYPALSMRTGGTRRVLKAHRVAYEAAYGPIPPGEQVHHRCSNTACVRPEHLEAATGRDNVAEMHIRRALEARIAALESALAAFKPDHPALAESDPDPDHEQDPTP